ncbi:MAG: OFA family MFS transporter [Candidatus Bathyarchaeia archaeon]
MEATQKLKLFGMGAEKGRWIFVILGLLINICMGTIYAWSVFRKPLESLFAASATESLLPFILFLALFGFMMPFSGKWMDKYGPKKVAMLGGVMVGIGWLLGSRSTNMALLSITYGVIGGAGVGLAYGCPIGVSGRWFPDKKGLAVGSTVLGFGISPLVTAPLANMLISLYGPLQTLAYLGAVFLVALVILSLPLKFPPANWKPTGWAPEVKAQAPDIALKEMIHSKSFVGLWACYTIGTLAGLMAIGISSPVGQEIFALPAATAATLTGTFAVFNGIGRPIFGSLTDKITPRNAAVLNFAIIAGAATSLGLFSDSGQVFLYVGAFICLWFCLGGWLAIAPTATATFYGLKYYGSNYGVVFTAYGMGAIIGNLLAGSLRDMLGSYVAVFFPVAGLAAVGILIALALMKPPAKKA